MTGPRRLLHVKKTLLWALLGFVLLQVGFSVVVDTWHPELYDPEYDVRLKLLRQRMGEEPDRPLLLLIGSSRTVNCFRPEILPPFRPTGQPQPLTFNFSHLASGPAMNLTLLNRLLREGIRPRWLVVELMLPCLSKESYSVVAESSSYQDLPVLHRCVPLDKVYTIYLRTRLLPWYRHRSELLYENAPDWCHMEGDKAQEREQIKLDPLGGDTRWMSLASVTQADLQLKLEFAKVGYLPRLQQYQIKDRTVQAVHDMLDLCRKEQIPVVMVMTPESKEFQSWYSPASREIIEGFCGSLRREYGVGIIDARNWLADDAFADGHHTLIRGADAFTLRLGREVLQPLVEANLPGPLSAVRQ
jgi:Protein of unknown function (DUF1574)